MTMLKEVAQSIYQRIVWKNRGKYSEATIIVMGFKDFLERTGLQDFLTAMNYPDTPLRVPFEEYCSANKIPNSLIEEAWKEYGER